jgi:hypothetical protein
MTGSKRKLVIDTRRAEQNRAAQRAFRQRKELYVKELENKVRDMEILKDRVERLEIENKRLKYRVWELESPPNSTSATTPPAPANNTIISPTSTSYHHHVRHSSNGNDDNESVRYSPSSHYHRTNNSSNNNNNTTKETSPPQPLTHSPTTTNVSHHILPPPSPSPTVFRPIPVAYWDKDTKQQQHHHHHTKGDDPTTHTEQGRVLDDLVSILRTRHRPPIRQQHQPIKPEPMHT